MLYYCCCETFPTFTNKFGYINKYHIGYITGDLYPKIFFFTDFSRKLLLICTITTKWEMYDSN